MRLQLRVNYRADMAGLVGDAYRLPHATAPQLAGVEQTLRTLELERAERIKAEHSRAAPQPRTRGPRWIGRRGPNGRTSTSAADGSEARSSA
jgi:hypothetical protein